jgi:HAD superfamily hydrolase (TIGR01509 family)
MIFQNKTFEGAIFDMDGTMFDTERLRFKMLKRASKELFGQEISDNILYNSLGVSADTAEQFAKKVYGEKYPYKEIRELADQLERQYIREHGVPVKNGLYNLLERLKKSGVLIALATSSRREIAEEYLLSAKVLRFFDVTVCGEEVENGKPDPEIFLKAANELNCEPSNCLIFEDSQNGLLAASASGGLTVYIKDIKDPDPEIKALAFKSYKKLTDFLDELIQQMPQTSVPKLNEHFPQSIGYHVAGIHGFGAIGGGYLAQVFSHWDGYTKPQKIIGATTDDLKRQLVNALGKYSVKYESIAYFQTIKNITLIDMNDELKMIGMYKKAHIIGLALPEQAIASQAKIIAKGLLERYESTGESLTLLIVMNKIDAAQFVKCNIEVALKALVDKEKTKQVIENTFFSDTVVNRMVSSNSKEIVVSSLHTEMEKMNQIIFEHSETVKKIMDYSQAFSSKNPQSHNQAINQIVNLATNISSVTKFVGALSKVNVTLFNSEPDMPLYALKGSPTLERLRQVITVDNIDTMQEIKNKLSNGPHAIIAWYSALLGYKTIGQGMGDQLVSRLAKNIIKNEIIPTLLIENPNSKRYIDSTASTFLKRCRASFKDECIRVGRDPLRKLQSGERIIGAIQLAQKHGLSAKGLEYGVACAIMYALLPINENDADCLKIKKLYEKNCSVVDVLTYNGEYNSATYSGLDVQKDKGLLLRVQQSFDSLQKELCPT